MSETGAVPVPSGMTIIEVGFGSEPMVVAGKPFNRSYFDREDGPTIHKLGQPYRKVSVTWVVDPKATEPFVVATAEGEMTAQPGDLLCYDERSGNVWPIAAAYARTNYEPA